jgi:hypothetical protein
VLDGEVAIETPLEVVEQPRLMIGAAAVSSKMVRLDFSHR